MKSTMLKTALTLGLLSAVGSFAIDMYLPALTAISQDLNSSVAATQMTLTAYFMIFGLAQMIYGPWADQAGRKRPLYFGLCVFIAGSVICTFAPSIQLLILGRVVQASGAAVLMVVPRAIIRDLYTGPEATKLMALIMLVVSVSPMLAPLAGSFLLFAFDWRAVFVAFAIGGVFGLILLRGALGETLALENRVPVNVQSLLRGTKTLLRDRGFMGLTFVGGFAISSFFVFLATAPFVYGDFYGLTPFQFSIAFAVNAIGFFLASQSAGLLGAKLGMARTVVLGTFGFTISAAIVFVVALSIDLPLYGLIAGLFVANAFLGVVIPTSMVLALEEHGEIAGLASSLGGTLQMMVGGLLTLALSMVFDGGPIGLTLAIMICGILATATTLAVRR